MISFYPGPSAIWKNTGSWMQEACNSGILSVNHRSDEFAEMLTNTLLAVRKSLLIPEEYEIFFTSSATEAWEMILQSLPIKSSAHYFNGAFGKKWFEYAQYLSPKAEAIPFDLNEVPHVHFSSSDLVCLTHCETSNATSLSDSFITELRTHSKGQLIAVDATSSLGGVNLPWKQADIWFASVQKCLGLPAGMAIVVYSPMAAERAITLHKSKHYNAFALAVENARKNQTTHTPNVLNIFLLGKAMQEFNGIESVSADIAKRAKIWYDFLDTLQWKPLVENSICRANTVIGIKGTKEWVNSVKKNAKVNGFQIGNGYGNWKETSIRIANFPSVSDAEHQALREFLKELNTVLKNGLIA